MMTMRPREAKSLKPPAIAMASRIVARLFSSYRPGSFTSPSTETLKLWTSLTTTETSGVVMYAVKLLRRASRSSTVVSPAACISGTSGREIRPSGRTGTTGLTASLFQTEMSRRSSGPMRYGSAAGAAAAAGAVAGGAASRARTAGRCACTSVAAITSVSMVSERSVFVDTVASLLARARHTGGGARPGRRGGDSPDHEHPARELEPSGLRHVAAQPCALVRRFDREPAGEWTGGRDVHEIRGGIQRGRVGCVVTDARAGAQFEMSRRTHGGAGREAF